jgi:integrase
VAGPERKVNGFCMTEHESSDEILASFREWLLKQGYGADTVRAYMSRVGRYRLFVASRGSYDRPRMDPTDELAASLELHAYLDYCSFELQLKENSINAIATALEKFGEFVTGVEIRLPKYTSMVDARCRGMQAGDQVLRRLTEASTQLRAVVSLVVLDGLRISECLALKLDDVHLEGGNAFIEVHNRQTQFRQCVHLSATTTTALADWLSERAGRNLSGSEHAVFLNAAGQPISREGLRYLIKSAGQAAGLDVSGRILRSLRCLTIDCAQEPRAGSRTNHDFIPDQRDVSMPTSNPESVNT